MLNQNQLHSLSPTELLFLLKHLKIGKDYLKIALSKEEIDELFSLANISSESYQKLATDKPELAGASMLVINTIMTATLGAWMGISGFLEFRLDSFSSFATILGLAMTTGAIIGINNARLIQKSSRAMIETRKLQNLELVIFDELVNQRKEELREKTNELNSVLKSLDLKMNVDDVLNKDNLKQQVLDWIDQFQKRHSNSTKAVAEIEMMKRSIDQDLKFENKTKEKGEKLSSIFDKLRKSATRPEIILKSWIKSNYGSLFVQLIPTLLGGFSSLFVYLGGMPRIAKEMGQFQFVEFLSRPEVKMTELTVSVLITIYFGFSFIYLNHKNFVRRREIEKTGISIAKNENLIDVLDDNLLKIKEVINFMKQLKNYTLIK